jgi:hypothetical protein
MEPLFDHEKLDVYCVELEFIVWITDLLDGKGDEVNFVQKIVQLAVDGGQED